MKILQIIVLPLEEGYVNKWIIANSKDIEIESIIPFVRGATKEVLVSYYPKPKGRSKKDK